MKRKLRNEKKSDWKRPMNPISTVQCFFHLLISFPFSPNVFFFSALWFLNLANSLLRLCDSCQSKTNSLFCLQVKVGSREDVLCISPGYAGPAILSRHLSEDDLSFEGSSAHTSTSSRLYGSEAERVLFLNNFRLYGSENFFEQFDFILS